MDAGPDPQPVHAIAAAVGLSPRQLERLFVRYLHETPSRHYMKVRLERARAALRYAEASDWDSVLPRLLDHYLRLLGAAGAAAATRDQNAEAR